MFFTLAVLEYNSTDVFQQQPIPVHIIPSMVPLQPVLLPGEQSRSQSGFIITHVTLFSDPRHKLLSWKSLIHLWPSALFSWELFCKLRLKPSIDNDDVCRHPTSDYGKKTATDDPWARSSIAHVSHALQEILHLQKRISSKKKVNTLFHRLLIKNYIPVYIYHLISYWTSFQLHLLTTQMLWCSPWVKVHYTRYLFLHLTFSRTQELLFLFSVSQIL